MINGTNQPNGCPVPVTWFALADGTSCEFARRRFEVGDEIATHTKSHRELAANVSKAEVAPEIVGGRFWLGKDCDIPLDAIRGFRSPYLTTNPTVREVLAENDFVYDSSVMFWDSVPGGSPSRPWPFTMDAGLPHSSCTPADKFQPCYTQERWKGLWQVPIWIMRYEGQEYSMDVGAAEEGNGKERAATEVLKSTFDAAYSGNRAPVPFYIHEYWFNGTKPAEGNAFIKYALSKPDTYFVTVGQLIDWMRAPVPKDKMAAWLAGRCGELAAKPMQLAVETAPAPGPAPAARPLSWFSKEGVRPALLGRRMKLL
jgi:hypothetical protein